jgi:MFS family permease
MFVFFKRRTSGTLGLTVQQEIIDMSEVKDISAKRAIPKARWVYIIPPTVLIYIVAYMDRINVSFAMAGGMNQALGLSLTVSGLSAGIFFLGYLFLQVPGGHIAEHGDAKKFIFWTILAWGGVSTLTGLVQNGWQLLAMRFLLGVAEGGVWAAILVIIGNWFPKKELARANAMFMSSLCLSVIVTTPVSGWLVGRFDWRWLFIIEGLISLSLIFVWLPFVYNKPEDAKWLSKEEKEYLIETLRAEREAVVQKAATLPVSYKDVLVNRNTWLLGSIDFFCLTGQWGYLMWLPTNIKAITKMGMTNVGLLTAVPFIAALIGLYIFAALSDRSQNRRFYTFLVQVGFGLSYYLSTVFSTRMWVCYAFLVLAGLFTKTFLSLLWSMPALLFPPGIAGGARGVINIIGSVGSFLGPLLVGLVASHYNMTMSTYCLVVFIAIGAIITLFLPGITAGKEPEKKLSTTA